MTNNSFPSGNRKGPALAGSLSYQTFRKLRSKILSKRTLLIVVPVGLAILLAFLLYFIPKRSTDNAKTQSIENAVASLKQEQENIGLPARLKIPGIKVDAPFVFVGLTSEGAMDAPKNSTDVAWYNLGPRPGENGSAVIAGHYGRWKTGEGSVFDNLHQLRQGDKLFVEDEKGVSVSFVVRESRRYDSKAEAPEVFSSNDGKPHLNLVTCEGAWNNVTKSYPTRLVVFTDKEEL